jgi:hypothetical protein
MNFFAGAERIVSFFHKKPIGRAINGESISKTFRIPAATSACMPNWVTKAAVRPYEWKDSFPVPNTIGRDYADIVRKKWGEHLPFLARGPAVRM